MIIGVDAGALSITDDRLKVGVWRINYHLLTQLGRLDRINTYRLYSFRPIEQGIVDAFFGRATNIVLPQRGFFRAWLPLELKRRPVDGFLGLSQALPSFTSRNSIGFVYDLGFLHYPENYPDSLQQLSRQTKDLVRRAQSMVAISQTTAYDLVRTYQVPKGKITVCHPGISPVFQKSIPAYQPRHPYFLFVGALKRGKNIPTLLEAFAKFLSTSKVLYDLYLVGGNYWFDPAIDETISRLSLRNRVKCLGVVPDEKLAAFYRGAVALVVPSFWEGFCLPMVEAMASRCPVIATTGGALPEIVGKAGLTVEPKNVEAMLLAMQRILSDPLQRQRMIKLGSARAKQFSWTSMARCILDLIRP